MKEANQNGKGPEMTEEQIDFRALLFKYIIHWPWFLGAVLVCFLFLLRVRGESKNSVGSELFCRMLVVTLLAQATETLPF
jgi:hypothetical protein